MQRLSQGVGAAATAAAVALDVNSAATTDKSNVNNFEMKVMGLAIVMKGFWLTSLHSFSSSNVPVYLHVHILLMAPVLPVLTEIHTGEADYLTGCPGAEIALRPPGADCRTQRTRPSQALRLPSGRGAGGGVRTRDRRVPADLRADSLATVPLTHTHRTWLSPKIAGYNNNRFLNAQPDHAQKKLMPITTLRAHFSGTREHDFYPRTQPCITHSRQM
ncbi:hypothetical protein PoB_005806700 [Plakobranchus ocellatus]|uniref:Uncharacterized protein n=1 Tax=Plakobranchus ocellatus TaxID=259542 RepID=A0AAV4CJI7_9GAST|nr:hypothetical protein PoB_005806700 [Plakobranchus ocellatus]